MNRTTVPLSPQVFSILSALIEERAGLHYDLSSKEILSAKLAPRMVEAGFDSWLDYYYFLRYDPAGAAELDAAIEALVVHETYLFRELEQLRMLMSHIVLPQLTAGQRLRIWSAACATGEEPVSIAIMLADRGLLDGVEICASDISEAALARARRGAMGRRALRAAPPPEVAGSRFLRGGEQGASVDPEILAKIDWRRVNLVDRAQVGAMGDGFDVVLCRNVLIYFSEDTARRVVDALAAALRPGGVLLVGVSESLLRFGTLLACEEHGGVFFYRKSIHNVNGCP
jgi:chemotaxis protein methyltransferase CheR